MKRRRSIQRAKSFFSLTKEGTPFFSIPIILTALQYISKDFRNKSANAEYTEG